MSTAIRKLRWDKLQNTDGLYFLQVAKLGICVSRQLPGGFLRHYVGTAPDLRAAKEMAQADHTIVIRTASLQ